jgi:cadmium resistance protein CadD (predicted permease)
VAALAAAAFAASNVDDLFVLAAFSADPSLRRRHVVAGQFLGIGALTAASLLCALAAVAVPAHWLGFLGLLPIVVGVRRLLTARRVEGEDRTPQPARAAALSVAAVTIANGGDNLAVYVPLFATQPGVAWPLIVAVFAVLTAVWCAAAVGLVAHPAVGPRLRRYGRRWLPWVLIALGLFIIAGSGLLGVLV